MSLLRWFFGDRIVRHDMPSDDVVDVHSFSAKERLAAYHAEMEAQRDLESVGGVVSGARMTRARVLRHSRRDVVAIAEREARL